MLINVKLEALYYVRIAGATSFVNCSVIKWKCNSSLLLGGQVDLTNEGPHTFLYCLNKQRCDHEPQLPHETVIAFTKEGKSQVLTVAVNGEAGLCTVGSLK